MRDLSWVGDVLVVAVTPTYSGCPATDLIATGIREALESRGVQSLRIETRLSPPWSTDWIAPEAKVRLREFGIAPPGAVRAQTVDVRGLGVRRRPADRGAVSAVRFDADDAARAVRLDRVQGAVPLRVVPRAFRLFQAVLGPVHTMSASANGWPGAPIKALDEGKTGCLGEESNDEWRPRTPVPLYVEAGSAR